MQPSLPGSNEVVLSRVAIIGSIVLAIGLLALAFLAPWRAGAKRSPLIDNTDEAR